MLQVAPLEFNIEDQDILYADDDQEIIFADADEDDQTYSDQLATPTQPGMNTISSFFLATIEVTLSFLFIERSLKLEIVSIDSLIIYQIQKRILMFLIFPIFLTLILIIHFFLTFFSSM